MQNKHKEFLRRIKIEPEQQEKGAGSKPKGYKRENNQDEIDLQKELKRRFNELFGEED